MRTINTDAQSYEKIIQNGDFYVDKTMFIREWYERRDTAAMIMRPRGFGKTMNLDMLNCFFSNRYAGRSDLFEGTEIWNYEEYRALQGTYPVIFLSFANTGKKTFEETRLALIEAINEMFRQFREAWKDDSEEEKEEYSFMNLTASSSNVYIQFSLKFLSSYLQRRYGKKVLIFLDGADAPAEAAYVNGYWKEMSDFLDTLFVSTFKSNHALDRALLTGVFRVPRESSGFSEFDNLNVMALTKRFYETSFGFTQEEVERALQEYHLSDRPDTVREWYGGFAFGKNAHIYHPYSFVRFLKNNGRAECYRDHPSTDALISHALQIAASSVKSEMEDLLYGGTIEKRVDEEIELSRLNMDTIWSLLLADGYLKVVNREFDGMYCHSTLSLTNLEAKKKISRMIRRWFEKAESSYAGFMEALKTGDEERVEQCLEEILVNTDAFYDADMKYRESEGFCHGLVLELIAQEEDYHIVSNKDSGYERYDIMMKSLKKNLPGIIIEFKVFDARREKDLEETAERALEQIRNKNYDAELISEGISEDHIIHYGMGFRGKQVVIRESH